MQYRFTFLVLIVAVVALTFAVWPAVADAPWEEEPAISEQAEPRKSTCDLLFEQLVDADTDRAAMVINVELDARGCKRWRR